MKKIISILTAVLMLISVASVSTAAYAANYNSIETTTHNIHINITVNGKPSNNGKFVVTEHVNHDKTVTIHFTYNGSEEVDKWEINGLIEGHHYEIIQKTDTDFIVKVDYSDANTIIANVVTKNGSKVKPNKDKYSPSTGSVTIGSTAAMLGVGLLILKRKLR